MIELLKQCIFAGVGLAGMTKDKLEELAGTVAREARLTQEQARAFKEELRSRTDRARQDLESEIDRRIDHAFVQAGIIKAGVKKTTNVVRDELQTLIDRRIDEAITRLRIARQEDIESLNCRVELLEGKLGKPSH
jgi:polyhydroxyalkanoate synthesis regulator phasin